MRSEEDVMAAEKAQQEQEQQAMMMQALQSGSQTVGNFAGASKDMAQAKAVAAESQAMPV
jgi:hypothetical protein